jgi:hypothetical protein
MVTPTVLTIAIDPGNLFVLALADHRHANDIPFKDQFSSDKTLNVEDGLAAMQFRRLPDQNQPVPWPDLTSKPDILHARLLTLGLEVEQVARNLPEVIIAWNEL